MNVVDDPDVKLLVFIVLVAGLAGAVWFFRDDILPQVDEPVVMQPEAVVEEGPTQSGPVHPITPFGQSMSSDRKLVPLPPLDDSDSYLLLALIDIFGPDVEPVLVNEALVDNFVATIDNLTRSHVAEKIRPVRRLSESFVADAADDKGLYYLNPR